MTVQSAADKTHYASCLVCGSGKTRPYLEVGNWTYHLCDECRCVFLPFSVLEGQEKRHTGRSYKLSRLIAESHHSVHNAWLVELMRTVRPSGRMLEVGCGAGFFLKAASDAGYEAVGVDLGDENVFFGKVFLGVDILNADFLEFPDDCLFDWVVMHQLIEHVTRPREFIQKARSLLEPEGYLLITTANLSFAKAFVNLFLMLGRQPPMNDALGHPPNHCVLFEPYTLRTVLNGEAFEVVELGHNPTGFKGLASMSLIKTIRRTVDKAILRLNSKLGSKNLIGPNMYCLAKNKSL